MNRSEVYLTFGNPKDPSWESENIVELHGSNSLPGVPKKWYVKVNKKIEPHIREALERAQTTSKYKIDRFGGYVLRHIRHDPSRPLSLHSWGIAFDVDPKRNHPKTFARGKAPRPWSTAWMKIWPNGVDVNFVEAFEDCGFRWGGDWGKPIEQVRYVDPMHFEWIG